MTHMGIAGRMKAAVRYILIISMSAALALVAVRSATRGFSDNGKIA
jgi:hypothetical protein